MTGCWQEADSWEHLISIDLNQSQPSRLLERPHTVFDSSAYRNAHGLTERCQPASRDNAGFVTSVSAAP